MKSILKFCYTYYITLFYISSCLCTQQSHPTQSPVANKTEPANESRIFLGETKHIRHLPTGHKHTHQERYNLIELLKKKHKAPKKDMSRHTIERRHRQRNKHKINKKNAKKSLPKQPSIR